MTLDELQTKVAVLYARSGYTADLLTLAVGLNEEAGKVGGAINNLNLLYKQREGRSQDSLGHELKNTLVYLCAIANKAGIRLADCVLPEDFE